MLTVYSPDHKLHAPEFELSGGELVPPFENPNRAEMILDRVREANLGEVVSPREFPLPTLLELHDPDYTRFLESAWQEWMQSGNEGQAIPWVMPTRDQRSEIPDCIEGKLGRFAFAADTSITAGTWKASLSAAAGALTAQALVSEGERAVFALCRPPGHHAATDLFGGYCFLNNAALAAQAFLDDGAGRVAVLDVDFHHGNGTQDIFYHRDDVLFLSLHGDPSEAFPYFWGHADETGHGQGNGWNLNYPLPSGSDFKRWSAALEDACTKIQAAACESVVVSLGVDTFQGDPISFFTLESEDFLRLGERLGKLGLPTVLVMEGGYAVEEIGTNTVNVLRGLQDA